MQKIRHRDKFQTYEVKASGCDLNLMYFQTLNLACNENKPYKSLGLLIQRYIQF